MLLIVYYKYCFKIIVKTDSSDYINSKVLFQLVEDISLYLITFFFKNLNSTKCNYKIYNKEMLTIVWYFE